jgi:hypothetical protein
LQRPTVIDASFCIGGKKEGEKMAKDPVCGMFVKEKPESGTSKVEENITFVVSNV